METTRPRAPEKAAGRRPEERGPASELLRADGERRRGRRARPSRVVAGGRRPGRRERELPVLLVELQRDRRVAVRVRQRGRRLRAEIEDDGLARERPAE